MKYFEESLLWFEDYRLYTELSMAMKMNEEIEKIDTSDPRFSQDYIDLVNEQARWLRDRIHTIKKQGEPI